MLTDLAQARSASGGSARRRLPGARARRDRLLLDHRCPAVAAAGGDLAGLDRRRESPRASWCLAADRLERRRLRETPLVLAWSRRSLDPLAGPHADTVVIPVPVEGASRSDVPADVAALASAASPTVTTGARRRGGRPPRRRAPASAAGIAGVRDRRDVSGDVRPARPLDGNRDHDRVRVRPRQRVQGAPAPRQHERRLAQATALDPPLPDAVAPGAVLGGDRVEEDRARRRP